MNTPPAITPAADPLNPARPPRRLTSHRRRLLLFALMTPLIVSGPCATLAVESAITGFFDGATAVLVDEARSALGLSSTSTTTTTP